MRTLRGFESAGRDTLASPQYLLNGTQNYVMAVTNCCAPRHFYLGRKLGCIVNAALDSQRLTARSDGASPLVGPARIHYLSFQQLLEVRPVGYKQRRTMNLDQSFPLEVGE